MYKLKNWLSEVCWDVGQTFVRWSYALEESAYKSKHPERVDGRTELSDMIHRLTPAELPITDLIKKRQGQPEWQTDDLEATDLPDQMFRLTPADTQFSYLLKKEKNSRAEWQTDDLKPDE
jgi:hypothetical protein